MSGRGGSLEVLREAETEALETLEKALNGFHQQLAADYEKGENTGWGDEWTGNILENWGHREGSRDLETRPYAEEWLGETLRGAIAPGNRRIATEAARVAGPEKWLEKDQWGWTADMWLNAEPLPEEITGLKKAVSQVRSEGPEGWWARALQEERWPEYSARKTEEGIELRVKAGQDR